jgi:hypothetical protein
MILVEAACATGDTPESAAAIPQQTKATDAANQNGRAKADIKRFRLLRAAARE